MMTIMSDVEADAGVHFGYGINETDWDAIAKAGYQTDGFGKNGGQLYVKSGLCVTTLHDEISWYILYDDGLLFYLFLA